MPMPRDSAVFDNREALAGAGIKTASDAVTLAQADTVSDGHRKAEEGKEDPETLPAG